jgi:hypothetical protein
MTAGAVAPVTEIKRIMADAAKKGKEQRRPGITPDTTLHDLGQLWRKAIDLLAVDRPLTFARSYVEYQQDVLPTYYPRDPRDNSDVYVIADLLVSTVEPTPEDDLPMPVPSTVYMPGLFGTIVHNEGLAAALSLLGLPRPVRVDVYDVVRLGSPEIGSNGFIIDRGTPYAARLVVWAENIRNPPPDGWHHWQDPFKTPPPYGSDHPSVVVAAHFEQLLQATYRDLDRVYPYHNYAVEQATGFAADVRTRVADIIGPNLDF